MISVEAELFPRRDKLGLVDFIKHCCQQAVKRNHFQVASISIRVPHIDPLAVLASIYERDELHYYYENPSQDEAIAAAEAILEKTFDGNTRFHDVEFFSQDILKHCIAVGDLESAFSGPHLASNAISRPYLRNHISCSSVISDGLWWLFYDQSRFTC